MAETVSDRTARASFEVVRGKVSGYRVNCADATHNLGLWDYRQNALNKGYAHAKLAHGISSPRTEWAADIRLFQEPNTPRPNQENDESNGVQRG